MMTSNINRTSPDQELKGWPRGIRYIVGNEACERFSYYGMNAILYVYVVSLYVGMHMADTMAEDLATSTVHFFKTGVYAFPMIGAIIADRLVGKYKTIYWLSIVYCLGHLALAFSEGSMFGLYLGLALIAIGSGGIKPCVSALVGDQFGRSNWHLVSKVYQAFYFAINFGSFFATWFIPLTQKWFGWKIAFGIPGVLMAIATFVFWLGRKHFVVVPASPGGKIGLLDTACSVMLFMGLGSLFFTAEQPLWIMGVVSTLCLAIGMWAFFARQKMARDDGFLAVSIGFVTDWLKKLAFREEYAAASATYGGSGSMGGMDGGLAQFSDEAKEGTRAVWRIMSVFLMVSIFWALFDQNSSSWIRQAEMMDLTVIVPFYGSMTLLSSQIQSINPILVMILIPILLYGIYPLVEKIGVRATPLRRMTIGMAIASLSFVAVALIQVQLDAGVKLNVMWQMIPYTLITLAEVLVSVTGLEFAYTQAPKRMKSTIMGFWLLTVSVGNVLVALLARFSHLKLVDFFWLFAGLMALAAFVFGLRAAFYTSREYRQ